MLGKVDLGFDWQPFMWSCPGATTFRCPSPSCVVDGADDADGADDVDGADEADVADNGDRAGDVDDNVTLALLRDGSDGTGIGPDGSEGPDIDKPDGSD